MKIIEESMEWALFITVPAFIIAVVVISIV